MQISEDLYARLNEQAARLRLTPEQLIERLLTDDAAPVTMPGDEPDVPVPPAGSAEALAAVQRLTSLFADVAIPDLEQVLADPLLALANADAAAHPGHP
jgi:hypothetical protein